jgi:hypothetical protein
LSLIVALTGTDERATSTQQISTPTRSAGNRPRRR